MTNQERLIGKFTKGEETKEIYLLNPGEVFAGFGGSSKGLLVRKTASLIVRETSPAGLYDTEYSIYDKTVWGRVFHMVRAFKTVEA